MTVSYTGKMEEEAILKFAAAESMPTVVPFNNEFSERIFSGGHPYHMIIMGESKALTAKNSIYAAFAKVAEKLKGDGNFVFVSVDVDDEEAEAVVQFFDLETNLPVPQVVAFQMEPSQKKYRYVARGP